MPKISVIIPAYDEERYIGPTIDSVKLAGKGLDVEIIVVANGCKDNTAEVARLRGAEVIVSPQPGISRSKNTGAATAHGDILIFLDADTRLSKDSIHCIIRAVKSHVVGSFWVRADRKRLRAKSFMTAKNLLYASGIWKGTNGIIFITRDAFRKAGGFDERLRRREDSDLVYKAARHGKYIYIRDSYVITSMRRYEQKGYLWVIWYWISVTLKGLLGKGESDYPSFR